MFYGHDNLSDETAAALPSAVAPRSAGFWNVLRNGQILQVSYGADSDFPQYAALHTDSSFLRFNYGKQSGWGTSIILLPSFWTAGRYHQGAPIVVECCQDGLDLVISFGGLICSLYVQGEVRLSPPEPDLLSGTVTVSVHGDINLDRRPGEAFKPVVLSSMHIAAHNADAASARVNARTFQMPTWGWIVRQPIIGRMFALRGGSSPQKPNAPSVEIAMTEEWAITGWKTESLDPDDDNIGFWAASEGLVRLWEYAFEVKP